MFKECTNSVDREIKNYNWRLNMNRYEKKLLCNITLPALVAAAFLSLTSEAATITGSQSAATGITNLLFTDGAFNYSADARFANGLYSNTYTSSPAFSNNQAGAKSAAIAITDALNSAGVTGISALPFPTQAPFYLGVPYQLSQAYGGTTEYSFGASKYGTGPWELAVGNSLIAYSQPSWGWVVLSNISTSPVPLPATGWLLLSSFGGVAVLWRRRS